MLAAGHGGSCGACHPAQGLRECGAAAPLRSGGWGFFASPGQPSAGLLVIAFPGGPGTASLLHQAHRLQGRSPLPIELIDLATA